MLAHRVFFLRDDFALRGKLGIECGELRLVFWQVVFVEDGFDRTFWHACLTVDALFWVDVQHLLTFVEALYRANDNAIGVLTSKARLGNDVCHRSKTSGYG